MYYPPLLNDTEKRLQQEVRKFVRAEVSPDFIRALDRDEITYPREYVEKLAAHNLLGLRFDPQWGGRGLPWTAEVTAEANEYERVHALVAAAGGHLPPDFELESFLCWLWFCLRSSVIGWRSRFFSSLPSQILPTAIWREAANKLRYLEN